MDIRQIAREAMANAWNTKVHPADAVAVAVLREVLRIGDEVRRGDIHDASDWDDRLRQLLREVEGAQ